MRRSRLIAALLTIPMLLGIVGVATADNASALTTSSVYNGTPVAITVYYNGVGRNISPGIKTTPVSSFRVPAGICGTWYYTAYPRSTYPLSRYGTSKSIAAGYTVNVMGYRC